MFRFMAMSNSGSGSGSGSASDAVSITTTTARGILNKLCIVWHLFHNIPIITTTIWQVRLQLSLEWAPHHTVYSLFHRHPHPIASPSTAYRCWTFHFRLRFGSSLSFVDLWWWEVDCHTTQSVLRVSFGSRVRKLK